MSNGPDLLPTVETRERNWLPIAVAAAIVVVVAVIVVLVMQRGKGAANIAPVTAASDPYSVSLPLSDFAMSEAGNLAGGKVTYLDGRIANKGGKVVTGVRVQVLFRNTAHEVAQNETQTLKVIRMRTPYVDIEPVSTAPLKPGDEKDFRLIFDAISPNWDGAYPQVRILEVQTQ